MRDSNYLGAESLNWREPPPEHPPVKPTVSTVTPHQEYADFLHKGGLNQSQYYITYSCSQTSSHTYPNVTFSCSVLNFAI